MAQVILLTGRERRRRWSSDERRKILEAAFAPESNVSEVARRFDGTDLRVASSSSYPV